MDKRKRVPRGPLKTEGKENVGCTSAVKRDSAVTKQGILPHATARADQEGTVPCDKPVTAAQIA